MITTDTQTHHVSVGKVSMFLYPWLQLKQEAQQGNLFVCHIIREAKAIFDPDGYLSRLKEAFQLRTNYGNEISQATDLGWFLVRFGSELNSALEAKRTLWCIRTILIARSAETGHPVFSPKILADQSASKFAKELLARRHARQSDEAMRHCLRLFLEEQETPEPLHTDGDYAAFVQRFASSMNKVALQTLRQEALSQSGYA